MNSNKKRVDSFLIGVFLFQDMAQTNMECILLAGGLGTRLRNTIGDVPKCMAPVNGKPFLYHLFRYLEGQNISAITLSLGFLSDVVIDWLGQKKWPFRILWVIEEEPLGTGGGIRLAMERCTEEDVFVLNGDTMFNVDLLAMQAAHHQYRAEATLALKQMYDFDRYGTVEISEGGTITAFEEKAPRAEGRINGGVYLISREQFMSRPLPKKFSFEKDYLESYVNEGRFFGWTSDGYFIDIGVPQDYEKAQSDFLTLFPG